MPEKPLDALVMKQLVAVIDRRTTVVCLHAAGQIQPVGEPFNTLNGSLDSPPFHFGCRSFVVPWMPGAINDIRDQANAELLRRPLAQRRLGPGGEIGGRVPPVPRTPAPTEAARYVRADRALDVSDIAEAEWLRLADLIDNSTLESGDLGLLELLKLRGYDGLPRLVDREGMDRLAAMGWKELFRGLHGPDAARFAEQFKSGSLYAGRGMFGNGTYATADFAEAAAYARGGDVIMRMALNPEAKVIRMDDIAAEYNSVLGDLKRKMLAAQRAGNDELAGKYKAQRAVLSDLGRFATMRGYDVLIGDTQEHWVILNRTALAVER